MTGIEKPKFISDVLTKPSAFQRAPVLKTVSGDAFRVIVGQARCKDFQ
tara:strand:+ start:9575 stop:9718 length:144 start_codon:yes stop_codon:yes gene_type:complete